MPRGGQRKHKSGRRPARKVNIKAVDLFCGAGGLTKGLEAAGIDVVFGVDIDSECEYPYEANNIASFVLKSVEELGRTDFTKAFSGPAYTLLAGCAPCQPFSTYQREKIGASDRRWNLLQHFGRLVKTLKP